MDFCKGRYLGLQTAELLLGHFVPVNSHVPVGTGHSFTEEMCFNSCWYSKIPVGTVYVFKRKKINCTKFVDFTGTPVSTVRT